MRPIPLHIKPQPMTSNLKTQLGHGHVILNSIRLTLFLVVDFNLGSSSVVILCHHPDGARWLFILQECSLVPWEVLFEILLDVYSPNSLENPGGGTGTTKTCSMSWHNCRTQRDTKKPVHCYRGENVENLREYTLLLWIELEINLS